MLLFTTNLEIVLNKFVNFRREGYVPNESSEAGSSMLLIQLKLQREKDIKRVGDVNT